MLIYQKRVYPEDLEYNPQVYYLFSDNDKKSGHWAFRDRDNFLGIRVKNDEHSFDDSYWSDTTYEDNISKLQIDFKKVQDMLKQYIPVVYSEQTFNLDISEYLRKSPKTCEYFKKKFDSMQRNIFTTKREWNI
tara:strand:- start:1258 stop:1656 length:399 start_codon:yes stop_codon:yes gene_type:complete